VAKRSVKTKQPAPATRQIKWPVIGGVLAVGVITLIVLLVLAAKPAEALALPDYCTTYPDHCVSFGNEDAPVTVLEVFDFGCPHCRDFHDETWPLMEQSYVTQEQVHWVAFPYALSTDRIPAAASALCAQEQEAYFTYTKAMFTGFDATDNLTVTGFRRAAAATNLDMASFNECLAEGRYEDVIRDNIAAASQMGVNSTPTFFINGQKLKGNLPWPQFQQQIESWLSR
jgi:protein-disulfide isomerase